MFLIFGGIIDTTKERMNLRILYYQLGVVEHVNPDSDIFKCSGISFRSSKGVVKWRLRKV